MSTKRKALALVKPVVKPSAKVATKSKIDETRTAVSTGPALKSATKAAPETIEISSDSSSHYSDSDNEDVNSDNEAEAAPEKKQTTETKTSEPAAQQDEASDAENDDDDASPTFGDLARGNATIDVASALAAQEAAAANASSTKNTITVQRPNGGQTTISATSLGTVLNQALRTDDSDLLESCLQTSDPKIITNTITRMDSALAGVLLSKLAARMHRRPGRAFGLMKWIQTTLVAHGGSLVAQPEVVARLGELNRVLEERARGLPALLALKGKLDMLDQQMRWRKFVKSGGAKEEQENGGEESEEEDDVDEPGVVYVEGDEETEGKAVNGAGNEEDFALIDVGADGESDEEEGDDDEDEEEDDEEFDDAESLDEDEVDHDDVEESGDEDEEDDEDDEEDEAPPAKVQKTSSKFAKRK
ncbi:Dip2/Utp12 family-domain-containing protein [Neurospora tetraspora]|uniref:Dip2/Utp12 family-domain-containing protein n=1 Tax=Neurospora tetraspora TaxID=94610 RepID=A0AAE0MS05_9PEZI|nr:Dip2/Utp12 family-domain-containing protein [Neurospora tetraspora]